ncbi:MAG: pre-peptidase C-terminal domain-containing protein [Lachnospiraceae bacterium]|nr:pre-peptidase C-terminal domain-containing protein [Lachnospiraceae bacterium]
MFNIRRRLLVAACTAGIFGGGIALSPAIDVFAAPEEKNGGNDEFTTADEVTLDTDIVGALTSDSDVDYYKVIVKEDGMINLSFTAADVDDGWDYYKIRLYDDKRIPMISDYWKISGNTKGAEQKSSDKGVSAGTYYVEVQGGFRRTDKDYTLKVNFTASDSWEHEWNDSIEDAEKIDVNKKITGNITVLEDKDWYQFTLTEPGVVRYSFSHGYIDDGWDYWKANLYDENGVNLLIENKFAGNDRKESVPSANVGLSAGTYYFQVQNGFRQTGDVNYSFIIEYKNDQVWEREENASIEQANLIKVNETVKGSTTREDDADYYKVVITENASLNIKFGHNRIDDGWDYWQVTLLDGNGTEIKDALYKIQGNTTGVQSIGKLEVSAGTYYVKVTRGFRYSNYDYELLIEAEETKLADGFHMDENGDYVYIKNGEVATDMNGFVDYDGSKFFLVKGKVDKNADGLVQDIVNKDDWYYCSKGQAQTQYTGLAEYDGKWFYVEKGKLNTTLAAYVKYDGGLFFVGAGRIMTEVSGLAKDPNGSDWYFLAEGQAQTQYTGLALYDGAWFYVRAGKFAQDYTGTVKYDGASFNVVKGEVVQ